MEQTNGISPVVRPVSSATKLDLLGMVVYCNGLHTGTPKDFMYGSPGNLAGYSVFPTTFWFDNNPSYHKEGWDGLMAFSYNPTVYTDRNGHTWAVVATANRKDAYDIGDLFKYGAVDNPYNAANRFAGWLRATEGSHAIEYVKPNQEIGLFEFPEHMPDYSKYGMTDTRVPIKGLEGLVPINKVGWYVSKIGNREEDYRNLIYQNYITEGVGFNPVTEALIEKLLEKEGFGPAKEIEAIGVENFEREGIAAATYHNGRAILAASKRINAWASKVAEAYGLSGPEAIKFVKEFIWQHELFHVLDRRKGMSKDETEAELGELLAEFYEEVAQTGKPSHAKYYKALADYNAKYAKAYREGRVTQEGSLLKSGSGLEALVSKYVSEAKRLGLEGEAAEDYVASRLEKEANAIKSAGRKGKDAKGGDNDTETREGNVYEKDELNSEEAAEQESAESDGESAEAGGEPSGPSE